MGVTDMMNMPCLRLLVVLCAVYSVAAQTCNQDGSSYSYTEAIDTSTNERVITTNFCPNHPSFNNNPNYAVSSSTTIKVPAYPKIIGSATTQSPGETATASKSLTAQGGYVGVFYSGAMLYSPYGGASYGTVTGFSNSATYAEGNTFDQCGGHSSSSSSASYHYHVPPPCLLKQMGDTAGCNDGNCADSDTSSHSPQIGWAADGFPVYGPRGPSGTMMKTCTVTGGTYGTAVCTDDCGGYYNNGGTIDNFVYRYYMQGTYNTGVSCDTPTCPSPGASYHPHSPLCFRGCCPSGVTCSMGSFTLPSCGSVTGSKADGLTSGSTPSVTSSNGAGGSGTDMSTGLAQYTAGCACSSLGCASTTCSSQSTASTTCPQGSASNTCPGDSSTNTSNPVRLALLPVFALAVVLFSFLRQ